MSGKRQTLAELLGKNALAPGRTEDYTQPPSATLPTRVTLAQAMSQQQPQQPQQLPQWSHAQDRPVSSSGRQPLSAFQAQQVSNTSNHGSHLADYVPSKAPPANYPNLNHHYGAGVPQQQVRPGPPPAAGAKVRRETPTWVTGTLSRTSGDMAPHDPSAYAKRAQNLSLRPTSNYRVFGVPQSGQEETYTTTGQDLKPPSTWDYAQRAPNHVRGPSKYLFVDLGLEL